MITVTSPHTGRIYDVQSRQYGTHNIQHTLSQGGVPLAWTDNPHMHPDPLVRKQSSMSIEQAVEAADKRAESLNLTVIQS